MRTLLLAFLATLTPLLFVEQLHGQSEPRAVRQPRAAGAKDVRNALRDKAADFWIYEDVKAGFAQSKRTGKPLLVSIR